MPTRARRPHSYNPARTATGDKRNGQRRQAHAQGQDLQGQLRQEAPAPREEGEEGALNPKLLVALGALLAAAGVALGAFGAHALKARLPAELLAAWNTAVQYHLWHALGMIAVGLAAALVADGPWLRAAGALLVAGILLFSGSLYALALGAPKGLGLLTPFGGLSLILGWLALAVAVLRA